jgi:hypothetical protein
MKTFRIERCSFGIVVIEDKTYTDDLIILPDGKILKPWWRKRGHQLTMDDIHDLIDSSPEIIVAGTGVSGNMKPENNLVKDLSRFAIELIAEPNDKAIEVYNKMGPEKRVGACFHLTC